MKLPFSVLMILVPVAASATKCNKAYVTTKIKNGDLPDRNSFYELDLKSGHVGEEKEFSINQTRSLIWDGRSEKMLCLKKDIPSHLAYCDMSNGDVEIIGELDPTSDEYKTVFGLAVDDNGRLLTVHQESSKTLGSRLVELDPRTGKPVWWGDFDENVTDQIHDLAFDPIHKNLYGITRSSPKECCWSKIYKIDETGVFEDKGEVAGISGDYALEGIFFDPSGKCYGLALDLINIKTAELAELYEISDLEQDSPKATLMYGDLPMEGKLRGAALRCNDLPQLSDQEVCTEKELLEKCSENEECCSGLCTGREGKQKKCRVCARKKEQCVSSTDCCKSDKGRYCHSYLKKCLKCPASGCPY